MAFQYRYLQGFQFLSPGTAVGRLAHVDHGRYGDAGIDQIQRRTIALIVGRQYHRTLTGFDGIACDQSLGA